MEVFSLGEDLDDNDATTQYVIEQSLQESYKTESLTTSVEDSDDRFLLTSTEYQKIIAAIRAGQEEDLQKLTGHHFAFDEADDRGWFPLHEAAVQLNKNILEITFKAIKNDSYEIASLLVRFGADVNLECNNKRTALHEAARQGKKDIVNLLLHSGAEPDPRSTYGLTPLALAAQKGYIEIMDILLQKGANVLSEASDCVSIIFEAAGSGNPDAISLLLDYGADANVPKYTGHLPIHRAAYRGHYLALKKLIPTTDFDAIKDSGISPVHSAAAGSHSQCLELLLKQGFDVNFMLHPRVRRGYNDQRKSALYFAVANNDVYSVQLLLNAGALPNQDPVNCLQVALRMGNYELINLLLRHGANANYYCKVNTTHFPSALQYAFKDEVILRMLLNYSYDVYRCFDCPYGDLSHVPYGYEGWSSAVIKDNLFCEVITLNCLKHLSGKVVRVMLDYVDHVQICSKLKTALLEQKQWPDISHILSNPRTLQHLCRLVIRKCMGRLRLRCPVFMTFLSLPNRLKDYILFKEYDLYGQGILVGLR
ncbi:dynein axonemal heavy chain 12 isoform X2 [Latimeria chalumnae]|uniref:dynein axonemal heavy chain 12 isoform X2 n=1 Tax=Latimeria chalumnae TaxID=7897 RepID=UPI0003C1204C|nr:PREDICTED: ankyrin repeat and SOCS box protein 14 isoform X2 [Latimeria chalumnae]|eukprot:XP_006005819.1 PREDICTED: ankyrin repeat and SOCS box protein 14 isoform X2 [Latimeria chalumnae]